MRTRTHARTRTRTQEREGEEQQSHRENTRTHWCLRSQSSYLLCLYFPWLCSPQIRILSQAINSESQRRLSIKRKKRIESLTVTVPNFLLLSLKTKQPSLQDWSSESSSDETSKISHVIIREWQVHPN